MNKEKEEKKQDEPKMKRVLVFSSPLRHEIRVASRQIAQGEGQENVTIEKEVEQWLSK